MHRRVEWSSSAMSSSLAVPDILLSWHPDCTPGAGQALVRDFGPKDVAELHNRTGLCYFAILVSVQSQ